MVKQLTYYINSNLNKIINILYKYFIYIEN